MLEQQIEPHLSSAVSFGPDHERLDFPCGLRSSHQLHDLYHRSHRCWSVAEVLSRRPDELCSAMRELLSPATRTRQPCSKGSRSSYPAHAVSAGYCASRGSGHGRVRVLPEKRNDCVSLFARFWLMSDGRDLPFTNPDRTGPWLASSDLETKNKQKQTI